MAIELMCRSEIPAWFDYPGEFRYLVQLGIVDLDAWYVLDRADAVELMAGLALRYPQRSLVPFARRVDNDDVACWDKSMPGRVVVIHDRASPGWEQRDVYDDFWGWLRQAVEDMIERITAEVEVARSQD